MTEPSRVVGIILSELSKQPVMLCFLFWIGQGIAGIVLRFIFSYRLNPLFDPKLKKYTQTMTDWVPSFTDRYLRAGLYANWVARKEWFAKNRLEVQAVDFRSSVSPQTVRLCWIYTINNFCMGLEMIVGTLLLLTGVIPR